MRHLIDAQLIPHDVTPMVITQLREDLIATTVRSVAGARRVIGVEVGHDQLHPRLLADPRTGPHFKPANQQRVKEQLVDQFCQVMGGPCIYKGADMKSSHANLDITKADFNALVEVLQHAMDAQGIPFREQNKLLARLAPMHRDTITVK
mgnify:CR=1 FL=1